MNLVRYQLYLLEQHSESFKIWSAIIRINTEGKSLIMKLDPGLDIWVLTGVFQVKRVPFVGIQYVNMPLIVFDRMTLELNVLQ